jgi:hypothetical protein
MKILIIQENGRHEKNRDFRECFNLQRALNKIGVDTVVWGLGHENFSQPFDVISEDKDVIILLENYEINNWVPDLSKISKLKIFWSIDSHCIPHIHQNTVEKHGINIVLHAVFGHEKYFNKFKTYWFPNAYPNDLIKPIPNVDKIWDVGFCGNLNNRTTYLNIISKNFNLKKDIFVIGNEMVKVINEYKIHFNRNLSDDINYRTFETLGCKTFLLTNKTPGLEYLFDIDQNIITYDDKNLIEKIRFYLNNEEERIKITDLGYNHVINNHTFFKRAERLIEIINQNI